MQAIPTVKMPNSLLTHNLNFIDPVKVNSDVTSSVRLQQVNTPSHYWFFPKVFLEVIGISIPIVLCSNLSYDSCNVFKNICEFIFSIVYTFLEKPYFLVQLSCFSDLSPRGAQDARQCLAKTLLRVVPILWPLDLATRIVDIGIKAGAHI